MTIFIKNIILKNFSLSIASGNNLKTLLISYWIAKVIVYCPGSVIQTKQTYKHFFLICKKQRLLKILTR